MTDIVKLYIWIPVRVTLTFVEVTDKLGSKILYANFLANSGASLGEI